MRRILLECRRSLGRALQAAATRLLTYPALFGELTGDALTAAGAKHGVYREADAAFRRLIKCQFGLCDETYEAGEHTVHCKLGWAQYADKIARKYERPQA